MRLRVDAFTAEHGLVEEVEERAGLLGGDEPERDRHAGRGELLHLLAGQAGVLEHAGAELAHDADELRDLAPRRDARRDRPVVGRLVVLAARCREPDGAGTDRLREVGLHQREVVVGRFVLEGALTHRPRT